VHTITIVANMPLSGEGNLFQIISITSLASAKRELSTYLSAMP